MRDERRKRRVADEEKRAQGERRFLGQQEKRENVLPMGKKRVN